MPADIIPSDALVAQHSFDCAGCNREAGIVKLFEHDNAAEIIRDSFTSQFTCPVTSEDFERIRGIVLAGDIQALHEFDLEIASFYCPRCRDCYCGDHWVRWNVFDEDDGFIWHDSIRGRCPLGHERMLED